MNKSMLVAGLFFIIASVVSAIDPDSDDDGLMDTLELERTLLGQTDDAIHAARRTTLVNTAVSCPDRCGTDVRTAAQKTGRNPQTGKEIKIPARDTDGDGRIDVVVINTPPQAVVAAGDKVDVDDLELAVEKVERTR